MSVQVSHGRRSSRLRPATRSCQVPGDLVPSSAAAALSSPPCTKFAVRPASRVAPTLRPDTFANVFSRLVTSQQRQTTRCQCTASSAQRTGWSVGLRVSSGGNFVSLGGPSHQTLSTNGSRLFAAGPLRKGVTAVPEQQDSSDTQATQDDELDQASQPWVPRACPRLGEFNAAHPEAQALRSGVTPSCLKDNAIRRSFALLRSSAHSSRFARFRATK